MRRRRRKQNPQRQLPFDDTHTHYNDQLPASPTLEKQLTQHEQRDATTKEKRLAAWREAWKL